jgi:hypothetical protein
MFTYLPLPPVAEVDFLRFLIELAAKRDVAAPCLLSHTTSALGTFAGLLAPSLSLGHSAEHPHDGMLVGKLL